MLVITVVVIFLYDEVLSVGLSPDTCYVLVLTQVMFNYKMTLKMSFLHRVALQFFPGFIRIKSAHSASSVVTSV